MLCTAKSVLTKKLITIIPMYDLNTHYTSTHIIIIIIIY